MEQRRRFSGDLGTWYHERLGEVGSAERRVGQDEVLAALDRGLTEAPRSILEIGTGSGYRIAELQERFGCRAVGIDPAAKAIEDAESRHQDVEFKVGSAERLNFPDGSFDIVFFGFSLFLCDRQDLFSIAAEADRVLTDPGHMVILDFHTPSSYRNKFYDHDETYSFKMDYSRLFLWNPAYSLVEFSSVSHSLPHHRDEIDERLGIHVLRKSLQAGWSLTDPY